MLPVIYLHKGCLFLRLNGNILAQILIQITMKIFNVSDKFSKDNSIEDCFMTYIVKQPNTSYIINSVAGCVVNVILGITGTFLNSLVVCTFWKSSKLRKKVSYFIIMILSFIDIGVGVIVHPLHVMNSMGEILRRPTCLCKMLYQTSSLIFSGMSTLTFLVMNMERYLSIVYPIFHLKYVVKRKCLAISILLWLICIMIAIAPVFGVDIKMVVTSFAFIVCFETLFVYTSIYLAARRRIQPVNQTKQIYVTDSRNTETYFRELQLCKMYAIVIFCSFLTQFPNALVLVVWSQKVTTLDKIVHVKVWIPTVISMNSALNSLIFFWWNKTMRKEGLRILKQCWKR